MLCWHHNYCRSLCCVGKEKTKPSHRVGKAYVASYVEARLHECISLAVSLVSLASPIHIRVKEFPSVFAIRRCQACFDRKCLRCSLLRCMQAEPTIRPKGGLWILLSHTTMAFRRCCVCSIWGLEHYSRRYGDTAYIHQRDVLIKQKDRRRGSANTPSFIIAIAEASCPSRAPLDPSANR